jgi:MFS family permease
MTQSPRWLAPLCLASLLWAFSFGVNAPLASLWLRDAHCGDTLIGLNTGTYYLGIALAACAVPWLMRRCGWQALLLGMFASGITAAAFPWGRCLAGWFVLRLLNGAAAAISLIPLETYVNHHAPPGRRAGMFGAYAFCIALGMALGTLVGLQMYADTPRTAFIFGGIAALFGAVVILVWQPDFDATEDQRSSAPVGFARNFLSFGSAWSQGFMEGAMVALLPIYLLAAGLTPTVVAYLMSGVMIGVILAQAPVAWLADRLGRKGVLVGCNVVTLVGIGCLLIPVSTSWLAAWLFAVGACSGAFYPLGLALLGERTPPAGLARANAWYLGINCMGSLTGPIIAGAAMDWFGPGALFTVGGGAVGLVLMVWIVLELDRRKIARERSAGRRNDKEQSRPAA